MGEEKLLDKLTEEISMQSSKEAKRQWDENEKKRWIKNEDCTGIPRFLEKKTPKKDVFKTFLGISSKSSKKQRCLLFWK